MMKYAARTGTVLFAIVFFGGMVPTGAHAGLAFPTNIIPCGGSGEPSCNLCHLLALIKNVGDFGVALTVLVLGPLAIVVGGFLILTAASSEKRLEQGKKAISAAVIGMVIALASFLILRTFFWVVNVATSTLASSGAITITCQL